MTDNRSLGDLSTSTSTDNWELNHRASEDVQTKCRPEPEALRASGEEALAPRLLHDQSGSVAVLFRDLWGSTSDDAHNNHVRLPITDELKGIKRQSRCAPVDSG